MEILPAPRLGEFFEAGAPVGGTHRTMKEPFRKGSEVEASPAHQHGNLAALPDVLKHRPGLAGIVTGREEVRRIADVDHVMGNLLPLGQGRLCAADIESAEDLNRVVIYDFAVEGPGDG